MNRNNILRGNVLWLSVVSFLNDVASEMIYPLLPYFLTQTLRASAAFLGVVEGIAETTASLLKLFSGWFSDRIGRRKPLVFWGYGIAGVARPMIALATAPWQVLAIRFSDRVGKGIRTAPRDALLAASVEPALRGRAYGLHRAADHAGAVIGPLIAMGLLLLLPDRYRVVFALAAVPAILSVILLAVLVKEEGPRKPVVKGETFEGFRDLGSRFYGYLLIVLVFTLGNATDAFLLLRAQELGVTLAILPLLWAVLHVSKMLWNLAGGTFADRFGPRAAIVSGWAVYAATYAGFAYSSEAWQAWVLFIIYGVFFGLTEAPQKVLVAAVAPDRRRGAAFGAYHFSVGIAALPASVLFGVIWDRFGPRNAFLFGASLAIAAAVALALLNPVQHFDETE